ncbi:LysR family transcriptional regulator [Stappia sp. MMSF_3263]|uniref:LysR family transcriptional regulator n=1 Tax=Stappia sp. MMSF_3263 TaxID=3046693 RepID=UPI00273F8943|nr:LysR family transcriptional regulator [Stappia sp. MMSF_3263]
MNIDDMRALVAVVEGGTLAQAAARLHLTQPAITRRLQRLEESLGVTLLDRDQKPARPTEQGRSAYRACVDILRATEDLRRAVGRPSAGQVLRLGVTPGVMDAVLRPVFDGLARDVPDGRLDLRTGPSIDLRAALRGGELDAAIVFLREEKGPDPRETAIRVGMEEVSVVAARSAGLPERMELEDLADHPFVINPDGCGFRTGLEHRFLRCGKSLTVAASVWGIPQQLQLIVDGVGIGLVPRRMVRASMESDRLQIIEVPDFTPRLAVWMMTAGHLPALAPALEAVRRAAEQVFETE